jgi:hypothetical protein
MFSFGQFAHIIPLLILALTSLVGFTSYHIAQINKSNVLEIQKEKMLNIKDVQQKNNNNTYHYFNYFDGFSGTDNKNTSKLKFVEKSIKYPPDIVHQLPFLQQCYIPFERPPPYVA